MDTSTTLLSSSSRRLFSYDDGPEGDGITVQNGAPPSSADRTSETPYEEHGYLSGGTTQTNDTEYLECAYRKGRDEGSGIEVEEGLVSAQWGAQNEVVLKVGHLGVSSHDQRFNAGVDFVAVKAAAGIHNPDGSTGLNVSLSAHVVEAELTLDDGSGRASFSNGVGLGTSLSIGVRDKDGDGNREVCFSVEVEHVPVRGCIPVPF